jgi:diguanylate cyclase (GGDEF)-like protein
LADVALRLLADLITAIEVPASADLGGRMLKCRAELASQQDPQAIAVAADQCADACQTVVAQIEAGKSEKRREISALIELVREAMTSIAGDAGAFDTTLGQSVERFEAIGRIDNVREMQARLASEVKALKRVAAARRSTWDSRFASFGQRIAILEDQLVTTRHDAATDPLTQVANRASFDRTCREWTTTAHLQFVLALVRVDGLTSINNEFGNPAGDRVLVALAGALKAMPLQDGDLVARLGGGDFAVLANDLTLAQMETRLRNVMAKLSFGVEVAGNARIKPTISCGTTDSAAGDTSTSLMERAGQALLEARRAGKNRIAARSKPLMRDLMRH